MKYHNAFVKVCLAAGEGPVLLHIGGEACQVSDVPGGLAGGQGDLP